MPSTIRPILVTPDLDRLVAFYSALLEAVEVMRFPEDGPPFYVGLEVGNSELGISAAAEVQTGSPAAHCSASTSPTTPGSRRAGRVTPGDGSGVRSAR